MMASWIKLNKKKRFPSIAFDRIDDDDDAIVDKIGSDASSCTMRMQNRKKK